ncbi:MULTISPECIES: response regulator transcription factor [unclassified Streptomyces]|uniref:response regulator transcription factor n=1 Tax=unclassified Streptomyces TaxID=2593676 RepID=UPI000374DFFE|nr:MULTISPECIES: response regulator transcription factor [unclassified Streptomyces]
MNVTISAQQPRVLVVEDEASIASMLAVALQFLGFDVVTAGTGGEAVKAAAERAADVILLDVGLPDLDGFEVCRRLRAARVDAPVLFLTARDAVEDKIRGLALGGDDYVTKPFDINEVAARVNALLRRGRVPEPAGRRLRAGWVELDADTHEVWRHGRPVQVSATEFALLRFLLENPDRVVSRGQILDAVWSCGFQGESGIVETYIYYLRRKLGDTDQSLIRTVRGAGYLVRAAQPGDTASR